MRAEAQGYPDYQLREIAREAKDKYGAAPLLAAKFRPLNASFALDKQSASPISAMSENFSWRADGSFIGLSSLTSGKRLLRAPVWLPREWDSALHQRGSALFLNQGYPLTLDEQFTIELPSGSPNVVLPACRESNEEPLRWRVEWTRVGDEKLVPHFHAQLLRGELSFPETQAFQKQLRELINALGANATFSSTP